jgi:hypothetical protein
MITSDKKKNILKLIYANKKGVSIDTIIDFLDYLDKVIYDKYEIEIILKELIFENKVFCKNNLYFIVPEVSG